MADEPINLLNEYEGAGPVPGDALFVARNPATGKDRRVPASRLPVEFTALVAGDVAANKGDYLGKSLQEVVVLLVNAASTSVVINQINPPAQAPKAPAAPTNGHVDDTAKVFFFQPTAAYPAFSQYKVAGLPGTAGPARLDGVNSYVSGELVAIHVNGPVPKGGLVVFVAGSGNVPDGTPLLSEAPFTGAATTGPPETVTPGDAQGSDAVAFTSATAS